MQTAKKRETKGKRIRIAIVVLTMAVGYAALVRYTKFRVPCLFHMATGWYCPGCGITRLMYALARGEWESAYQANCFLFTTWPVLGILFALSVLAERPAHHAARKWRDRMAKGYLAALLVWFAVRNLRGW